MLLRQLRFAVAGLAVTLFSGTLGYVIIEGWSWLDALWMVAITFSTVGYGEVAPLSPAGRLYTIALIFVGFTLATYAASEVARLLVDGGLVEALRDRRRKALMRGMSNHYVVVGYGRLGKEVCAEIAYRGHPIVIIESDSALTKDETFALVGDGTSDDILKEAGVERAKGLAACTGNDATNLFVTLSARQLNPSLRIVTRVDDEHSVAKALRVGASAVLNPYGISGQRIAQGLLQPVSATLVDQTVGRNVQDFDMEDVAVGPGPINGSLRELRVSERFRVLVVVVKKADGSFHPGYLPTVRLEPGDVAVVAGQPENIRRFADEAQGT
ncbi:MAG: potassium channel family protein [Myxococcota bacterium]